MWCAVDARGSAARLLALAVAHILIRGDSRLDACALCTATVGSDGAAVLCLPCRHSVRNSGDGDWREHIAGKVNHLDDKCGCDHARLQAEAARAGAVAVEKEDPLNTKVIIIISIIIISIPIATVAHAAIPAAVGRVVCARPRGGVKSGARVQRCVGSSGKEAADGKHLRRWRRARAFVPSMGVRWCGHG